MSNQEEIIATIDNMAVEYELEFVEQIPELTNDSSYFDKIKLIYLRIKNEIIHLFIRIKGKQTAIISPDDNQDNYIEMKN
jgi:hypothetical protein